MLATRAEYAALAPEHHALLAGADEPGDRLIVLGRLLDAADGSGLPGRTIIFYQAGRNGSYDEAIAGDESSARLRGEVTTDADGRFVVSTVLPGDYGATSDNRHIHMSVSGARVGNYDYYFSQYLNYGLRRWAEGTSHGIILELASIGDTLVALGDLAVRRAEGDE